MDWLSWLNWVIAIELVVFALAGVWLKVGELSERAAMRRLAPNFFTQPIVSMEPPTNITTVGPDEWIVAPPR